MSVKLSEGNTKMGKVLHVNLPPRITCNKTVPCCGLIPGESVVFYKH